MSARDTALSVLIDCRKNGAWLRKPPQPRGEAGLVHCGVGEGASLSADGVSEGVEAVAGEGLSLRRLHEGEVREAALEEKAGCRSRDFGMVAQHRRRAPAHVFGRDDDHRAAADRQHGLRKQRCRLARYDPVCALWREDASAFCSANAFGKN